MIAAMRMTVRVAVTMRVHVPGVVAVIEVMMRLRRGNSCLLQLLLETPLNLWVFLIRLDLLHIQRYAQSLWEITFCHREVSGRSVARVEVLVPPIIGRRND